MRKFSSICLMLTAVILSSCLSVRRALVDEPLQVEAAQVVNDPKYGKYLYVLTDGQRGYYYYSDKLFSLGDTVTVK
jgi:hypothetical protein